MAKQIEVKVWQEGPKGQDLLTPSYFTLIDQVTRPVIKGALPGVCYGKQILPIQQLNLNNKQISYIIVPHDGYPWEKDHSDQELERQLGWFCTNHDDIEEVLNLEDLIVCDVKPGVKLERGFILTWK